MKAQFDKVIELHFSNYFPTQLISTLVTENLKEPLSPYLNYSFFLQIRQFLLKFAFKLF